jgi:hypothetical protein
MKITDKLRGMPRVYYCNLDSRTDKQEYMESQFDLWEINYTRVSSSKYTPKNYDEWKNNVILDPKCDYLKDNFPEDYGEIKHQRYLSEVCFIMTQIETIRNWLETTNEKYMILMEDDHDLSMIEYMHFDWEYLMNHIPYDWDVIQFEVTNRVAIPCFLHPTLDKSWTGPLLIHREYAKKIVRIHYTNDNRINLNQKISSYYWKPTIQNNYSEPGLGPDYVISKNGRGYSLPLIYLNPNLGSYDINIMRKDHQEFFEHIKKIYHKWWKILRDEYTLEDFFTHGKPNDLLIKVDSKFS